MNNVVVLRLVEVNEKTFEAVLAEHPKWSRVELAKALSFAFHYNKLLFVDVDSSQFHWVSS